MNLVISDGKNALTPAPPISERRGEGAFAPRPGPRRLRAWPFCDVAAQSGSGFRPLRRGLPASAAFRASQRSRSWLTTSTCFKGHTLALGLSKAGG
ncbi:hypothetical protein AUK22_07495 [bacterium CG2_30_54_10]|nr:MAG: hypothetical protein AUK22_07495 [bacterium CG2_30_54_10]